VGHRKRVAVTIFLRPNNHNKESLTPKNDPQKYYRASFYAQAAEACIKMEDVPRAVDYYQKALKLEPANERYRKRYKDLKADN